MGSNPIGERLREVYRRLFERYGPQHWWPGDGHFEMMAGAILTQSAAWTNVEKAIGRLKEAGALSPEAIRRTGPEELAGLVYSSGYHNAKARKLKALADWLLEKWDDDLERMFAADIAELRRELLAVWGVGEETADSILLYAAGKPVFVIDAYTRRIFDRLGLKPEGDSYASYQSLFMDNLSFDSAHGKPFDSAHGKPFDSAHGKPFDPAQGKPFDPAQGKPFDSAQDKPGEVALFNEYHALLVCLGKNVCRKKPLCGECCLRELCRYAINCYSGG